MSVHKYDSHSHEAKTTQSKMWLLLQFQNVLHSSGTKTMPWSGQNVQGKAILEFCLLLLSLYQIIAVSLEHSNVSSES